MSDWTEIVVTALAAGGAVGSIVLVAVKVWLEKSISAKFDQTVHYKKMQMQEHLRRSVKHYDEMYDALRTARSLSYRARNAAREIYELCKQQSTEENINSYQIAKERLETWNNAVRELLYEKRSAIPDDAHTFLHDLNNHLRFMLLFSEKWAGEDNIAIQALESTGLGFDESYHSTITTYKEFEELAREHMAEKFEE